jgi:hypothetical protein
MTPPPGQTLLLLTFSVLTAEMLAAMLTFTTQLQQQMLLPS